MTPLGMSRAFMIPSSASMAERYGSGGGNTYIQNNFYNGAATSGSWFGTYSNRHAGNKVYMAPNMYDPGCHFHHHHHHHCGPRVPEWLMHVGIGLNVLGGIANLFKGNSSQGS